MSDPRADVALLIDFTDLCQSLMPDVPEPVEPPVAKEASEDGAAPAERRAAPPRADGPLYFWIGSDAYIHIYIYIYIYIHMYI